MSETAVDGAIRSLLVPVEASYLLLPGSVVAEVIGYTQPQPPADGAPDWFLGHVEWRGQRVPCIAYEVFNGTAAAVSAPSRARLIVLKGLSERPGLPFLALVARHIPRLLNVTAQALEPLDEPELRNLPAVQELAVVQGETAIIPDMEAVESHVAALA